MSSESNNQASNPPMQLQDARNQIIQGSRPNQGQQGIVYQWMPPVESIPLPSNPPAHSSPSYNQQVLNPVQSNVVGYMNIPANPSGTEVNLASIYLPNGARLPSRQQLLSASTSSNSQHQRLINTFNLNPNLRPQQRAPPRPGPSGVMRPAIRKPKRIRTAFTTQQMVELEEEYKKGRYLDRNRRIELSGILRLNERTIKIWFQNRRMKEKKDNAERLEEEEASSTTDSSVEFEPMPTFIHEQFVADGAGGSNVYSSSVQQEQYPVASTSISEMNNPMMIGGYPVYAEPNYEPQELLHQEVHVQMQHYPPGTYNNDFQTVLPTPGEAEALPAAPQPTASDSDDLSWIRSINMYDEF